MKKFIFLLLLWPWLLVEAQPLSIFVDNDSICTGKSRIIPLKVSDFSGVLVFRIVLIYPAANVQFDSIQEQSPVFSNNKIQWTHSPGRLEFNWSSGSALNFGNGTLLSMHFTGLTPGSASFAFDPADSYVLDLNNNPIPSNYGFSTVNTHPSSIKYNLKQIMEGCRKDNKGRYSISISRGKEPFVINWNGGFLNPGNDTVVLGLGGGSHNLQITDGYGCKYDTTYFVNVIPAPHINFTSDPDSVFIQKPHVQFYSNIDSLISAGEDVYNWQWSFGEPDSIRSTEKEPFHIFNSAYDFYELKVPSYKIRLWAITTDGCDTTVIKPLPLHLPKVNPPNVITPNGDGINDTFVIRIDSKSEPVQAPISKYYIRVELVILNRHGRKVYESNDYKNDWGGNGLSDGTYFYVLKCIGKYTTDTYQGSLTILGSRK